MLHPQGSAKSVAKAKELAKAKAAAAAGGSAKQIQILAGIDKITNQDGIGKKAGAFFVESEEAKSAGSPF